MVLTKQDLWLKSNLMARKIASKLNRQSKFLDSQNHPEMNAKQAPILDMQRKEVSQLQFLISWERMTPPTNHFLIRNRQEQIRWLQTQTMTSKIIIKVFWLLNHPLMDQNRGKSHTEWKQKSPSQIIRQTKPSVMKVVAAKSAKFSDYQQT